MNTTAYDSAVAAFDAASLAVDEYLPVLNEVRGRVGAGTMGEQTLGAVERHAKILGDAYVAADAALARFHLEAPESDSWLEDEELFNDDPAADCGF